MDITETYHNIICLRLLLYMCKAEKTHLDNRVDIRLLQVAYETELSGTPTAVFTEIQLIGQFLVLDIIIIVVILASQKVI